MKRGIQPTVGKIPTGQHLMCPLQFDCIQLEFLEQIEGRIMCFILLAITKSGLRGQAYSHRGSLCLLPSADACEQLKNYILVNMGK